MSSFSDRSEDARGRLFVGMTAEGIGQESEFQANGMSWDRASWRCRHRARRDSDFRRLRYRRHATASVPAPISKPPPARLTARCTPGRRMVRRAADASSA